MNDWELERFLQLERLQAELLGIGRPLHDWLAGLADEPGAEMSLADMDSFGTALIQVNDLAASTVDAARERWRAALDAVYVTKDLSQGRVFGTAGYRSMRGALARGGRGAADAGGVDAIFDELARLAASGEEEPGDSIAPHGAVRSLARVSPELLLSALVTGTVADVGVSLWLKGDLAPSRWPDFVTRVLSGMPNVPLPLLALPPLLSAMAAVARSVWRRRRHGGDHGARGRTSVRHRWVQDRVRGKIAAATRAILDWLDGELAERIADRQRQEARYAAVARRDTGHLEADAGLCLADDEWAALARRMAPAQPGKLLEEFARCSAKEPAAGASLAAATAEEVHGRALAWLAGGIAGDLAAGGRVRAALAALSDGTWRRCGRSLLGRATPGAEARPGSGGGDFQYIAAVPPEGDVAFHVREPLGVGVEFAGVVESALPGRIDVVAIGRHALDASELIARSRRRGSAGRAADVLAELPFPEIRQIALEGGLADSLGGRPGDPAREEATSALALHRLRTAGVTQTCS